MQVKTILVLFLCVVAFTSSVSSQEDQPGHRIVYGLTLQPSGFDPHVHGSSELGIPLRQVYDSLIYRDPATQAFVAGLATAWEVSPDGLSYTFTLRQDVRFHDRTPFNAQAVAANLDRIANPATGSQKAFFLLGPYAGYEIVDDYTIRILLSEPYSPLLDSLSQVYLGIASPTALAQYTNDTYQFHQVGTGPFRFVEYVPGDRLVIERNPEYTWGPEFYQPPSEDAIDQIEFRFFEDVGTRAIALEAGDAQIIGELLPTDARALSANSQIQLLPISVPGQPLQFLFNTRRFPTDDVRVRQALLYATNREAIIDAVYQRFSTIAWGPISANTAFYNRELAGAYAFNPSQAQALLTEVGYQDTDNNGYLDFGGVDISVDLIVPPWGLIPEVAQLIQDQWRTVGIRANLNQVPSRGFLIDQVETGEYNLVAWYEFGVDPAFLSRYFTTDGANNWTGFSDPALDNTLFDAQRQSDPAVRASLYAQAQRTIMDQALILPIRDYVNLNAASASIQGLAFDAYGWFPLLNNVSVSAG
ncbi:MAG TPA: ABC transporter substrate-binding protein [Oceanobacillus sp.]|nr:ABC transporter substrate-binding protein [Oceanobacillus sp.]